RAESPRACRGGGGSSAGRSAARVRRISRPDGRERRSEERRVGKECRSRWPPDYLKKKRSEAIRKMLASNLSGANQAGAAKRSASLLAGLMRCRGCGRTMMVYYTGQNHYTLRYSCFRV